MNETTYYKPPRPYVVLVALTTLFISIFCVIAQINPVSAAGVSTTYTSDSSVIISSSSSQNINQIATGRNISCGITLNQSVYCAGENNDGQLGSGSTIPSHSPVQYGASLGKKFTQVSPSIGYTCALTVDQLVYCSGSNSNGQFGNGTTNPATSPVQYGASLGKKFTQISSGFYNSCALTIDQLIYCAGPNFNGSLGNGTTTPSSSLAQFGASLGKSFTQVSAGSNITCGVTTDQLVYCAGSNSGAFGNGLSASSATPLQFGASTGKKFTQVSTSGGYTCALTIDQLIYCSGTNTSGQFGNGGTSSTTSPAQFGASLGKGFTQVSVAQTTTCARTTDQLVYCAGANAAGQFGNGTVTSSTLPVQFGASLGKDFVSITSDKAGSSSPTTQYRTTCALSTDQKAFCAGWNNGGFGNGSTANSSSPTASMLIQ